MKFIPGYEGLYAATEDGRIWSYRKKKFLKPAKTKDGYLYVNLCKDGKPKKCYLHRLVAETYIDNPDNLPQVSHIDETRDNNCVNNLCWSTAKENSNMPLRLQRVAKSHQKKVICLETQ